MKMLFLLLEKYFFVVTRPIFFLLFSVTLYAAKNVFIENGKISYTNIIYKTNTALHE